MGIGLRIGDYDFGIRNVIWDLDWRLGLGLRIRIGDLGLGIVDQELVIGNKN